MKFPIFANKKIQHLEFVCLLSVISSLLLFSCSKKDTPSPSGGGHGKGYGLSGFIIFNWATEGILKINLKTGKESIVLPENTFQYGWDVSRDGKKILQSMEDPNDLEAN